MSGRNGFWSFSVIAVHASVQPTVVNRDPQVVEEPNGRGLRECASHQQRAKAATKSLVNVLEKRAAEPQARAPARERSID